MSTPLRTAGDEAEAGTAVRELPARAVKTADGGTPFAACLRPLSPGARVIRITVPVFGKPYVRAFDDAGVSVLLAPSIRRAFGSWITQAFLWADWRCTQEFDLATGRISAVTSADAAVC